MPVPKGLVDIGGGFGMADPANFMPPTDALQKQLSLINLKNQIQDAPLKRQLLEADVLNIEVENLLKRAQLGSTIMDEKRKQRSFVMDGMTKVQEMFKVNPQLGEMLLQQVMPDATTTINADGTATIGLPTMVTKEEGGVKTQVPGEDKYNIIIDPNQITPEQRREQEQFWFQKFQSNEAVKVYGEQSRFFRIIQESAKLGTGAGDLAIVNAFAKILDPGGRVTESDVRNAMATVGMSELAANSIAKAWTEGGPIFGSEVPGVTRQNFVNAAKVFFQTIRKDVLSVGRDFAKVAKTEGLRPRTVLSPVGDITEDMFLMTDEELLKTLGGK